MISSSLTPFGQRIEDVGDAHPRAGDGGAAAADPGIDRDARVVRQRHGATECSVSLTWLHEKFLTWQRQLTPMSARLTSPSRPALLEPAATHAGPPSRRKVPTLRRGPMSAVGNNALSTP